MRKRPLENYTIEMLDLHISQVGEELAYMESMQKKAMATLNEPVTEHNGQIDDLRLWLATLRIERANRNA